MEIKVQNNQNQQNECVGCQRKQQLITKYEDLIALLKKKADKPRMSQSNKHSLADMTTSNSSISAGILTNRTKLPILIDKIQQKSKYFAFYSIKITSVVRKRLIAKQFLCKIQRLFQNKERQVFKKIKSYLNENQEQINQAGLQFVNATQNVVEGKNLINIAMHKSLCTKIVKGHNDTEFPPSYLKSQFSQQENSVTVDQLNYKSLMSAHEDFINSTNLSQLALFKEQSLRSMTIKQSSSLQVKNLHKKIFSLEQDIFSYQNKIKTLQTNMRQALNRQIKESTKKTESLQMVAQEMAEKNQLIAELNEKIIMLEEKYRCETNGILEDQLTQHRKQIQKLQKINIKLQNQLRKTKQNLIQTQSCLKKTQQQKKAYQIQKCQLKQKMFEIQQKIHEYEHKKYQLNLSCQKVKNVFEKIKSYEKILSLQVKMKNGQENLINVEKQQEINEFLRLELLFIYLYNIEDESYNFDQHSHLFDQQQLQVLKELKQKIKNLKNSPQKNLMDTIQCAEYGIKKASFKRFQVDGNQIEGNHQQENIYCNRNMVDGSIFDVLNDHRFNNSMIEEIPTKTDRKGHEQNLTMKLLQMQIEKNKQIEKISQLKEKNMYVRNIILNLMKSLQLRQNAMKTQTAGILQLIFDVFEYSQQEKSIIFTNIQQPKQKRFFGFI